MKFKLKTQFLALLVILSLGVLTGLEPALHNHDLDFHGEHEDCSSCNWTQVSIDNTASQTVAILQSYEESNYTKTNQVCENLLPVISKFSVKRVASSSL